MPLTPQINFTITLEDLTGAAIGAVGNPALVEIALANFGPNLPRVPGTTIIGRVGPWSQKFLYTGNPITVTLWGNDVIEPVGTYYVITIYDDKNNILQSGAYVFTGTISGVDFSSFTPIFPSASSSVMGAEVAVPFSASPTFNAALVNGPVEFWITLTGNVTSSFLLANYAGQIVIFRFQQDAIGGHSFAWPSNVLNHGVVDPAANSVTSQAFYIASNGNAYPIGPQTYS